MSTDPKYYFYRIKYNDIVIDNDIINFNNVATTV